MGLIDITKPLSTVISSTRKKISPTSREKFLGTPRTKPKAAEWEASLLPLCYAAPPKSSFLLLQTQARAKTWLTTTTEPSSRGASPSTKKSSRLSTTRPLTWQSPSGPPSCQVFAASNYANLSPWPNTSGMSNFILSKLTGCANSEQSALGGGTGTHWSARLFWFSQKNLTMEINKLFITLIVLRSSVCWIRQNLDNGSVVESI